MRKIFSLLLLVVLGVFTLNTTNVEAIDTYRDFQLDFWEKDDYVKLVVVNTNLDVVEMKLYRDNEFYLDLDVVHYKEYQLKNFVANKPYVFYILYRIKNDPNYYQSILYTFETSKDILSDFNDNEPVDIDLPDGVVNIDYYRFENNKDIYKLKYINSNEIPEVFIAYEEFPFHVRYLLKFHDIFIIKDNTFLIPELELKEINVSKENIFISKKEYDNSIDIKLYLKFKTPLEFIKEIKILYINKRVNSNKKMEFKYEPDEVRTLENFGNIYVWSDILSDLSAYNIKLYFSFLKNGDYEITDIIITYNHLKVYYDNIDYNDDYLPARIADAKEKGIPIESKNPNDFKSVIEDLFDFKSIDFKSFFEDLFNSNSTSDFFSNLFKYIKEVIIIILIILFLPLIVKLISLFVSVLSIIINLFTSIISSFIPRKRE